MIKKITEMCGLLTLCEKIKSAGEIKGVTETSIIYDFEEEGLHFITFDTWEYWISH